MEYTLCCEASDLCVKSVSGFAYCLGNFELAFLVVTDAGNSNSSTEIREHTVVSLADNSLKTFDLFAQLIVAGSASVDLGCQCFQLVSYMLQLL
jgi:hypothetical protein